MVEEWTGPAAILEKEMKSESRGWAGAFGEEVKRESTAALPRAPVAASASLGLSSQPGQRLWVMILWILVILNTDELVKRKGSFNLTSIYIKNNRMELEYGIVITVLSKRL